MTEKVIPLYGPEILTEIYNRILEDVQTVIQAIVRITQEIAEIFIPLIKSVINLIASAYPNRRVVWLAFYSKRRRVRKKNKAIIFRWLHKNALLYN